MVFLSLRHPPVRRFHSGIGSKALTGPISLGPEPKAAHFTTYGASQLTGPDTRPPASPPPGGRADPRLPPAADARCNAGSPSHPVRIGDGGHGLNGATAVVARGRKIVVSTDAGRIVHTSTSSTSARASRRPWENVRTPNLLVVYALTYGENILPQREDMLMRTPPPSCFRKRGSPARAP